MSEPHLTYKKGEGWVYVNTPSSTFESGYFRVTVEQRLPEKGEGWLSLYHKSLDGATKWVRNNYNWTFLPSPRGPQKDQDLGERVLRFTYPGTPQQESETVYTVKMERIAKHGVYNAW